MICVEISNPLNNPLGVGHQETATPGQVGNGAHEAAGGFPRWQHTSNETCGLQPGRKWRNGDDDDDDDDDDVVVVGGGGGGGDDGDDGDDGDGDDTDDDSQQLFSGWQFRPSQKHGDQKLSLAHEWMPHAWADDNPAMQVNMLSIKGVVSYPYGTVIGIAHCL